MNGPRTADNGLRTWLTLGLLILLSGCIPHTLSAQEKGEFTVDLQLTTRGEIRDGGLRTDVTEKTQNDDWASFLLGRTRLVLNYQRPHLVTRASVQHSGIWGQAGKGTLGVYEAWIRLAADNGLFAQVGRQALSYDDERIIGPDDWSMTGNSHDVIRLGFDGQVHKLHLIGAYNQNAENTNIGTTYYTGGAYPYKTMQMAWYHCDMPWTPLGVSAMFMNIGMQGGDLGKNEHLEWQQLWGGYLKWTPIEILSLEGSFYKQMGKNENGLKIDAWMAAAKVSLKPSKMYGFRAGYDYLSGDEMFPVPNPGHIGIIRHEVIRGFTSLYGSHHKFYGAMDFFYLSAYVNGFSPGLRNAYAGFHLSPMEGLRLDATYHYMAMAVKLPELDLTLGHEFEIEASWQFMKDAAISVGYSYMTGTKTMERLKRASTDGHLRWGWIALTVSPNLFSFKH